MVRLSIPSDMFAVLFRGAKIFVSSFIILTLLLRHNINFGVNKALIISNHHGTTDSLESVDKKTLPIKRILFWTKYYETTDYSFGFGQEPFLKAGCKITNCWTTDDRSWLNMSDSVFFDAMQFDPDDLPPLRWSHQRYVYVHHEALPSTNPEKVNYKVFRLGKPNFFNWTMTHRRDSNIFAPNPYGILVRTSPYPPQVNQLPIMLPPGIAPSIVIPAAHPPVPGNKTKLMIYFASNCDTSSRREVYVKELRKFVPIDTYGGCGEFQCEPWNGEACFENKLPNYKFQLVCENSLCPDYVAERFWRSLKWGAVPVIYGAADYSSYAPPHSYIHVADFASLKDLSDYLFLLDRNDALYAKYFEWRKDWEVIREPKIGWCDLCEKLNDPSTTSKAYANLSKWWFQDGPCYPTNDFLNRLLVPEKPHNGHN